MRQEDITEALDLGGLSPSEAIRVAVKASCAPGKAYIAYVNKSPEVIFGVAPSGACLGVGHPWLLGTDVISRLPIRFVRESLRYVTEWLQEYPILTHIVDGRNTTHIRWLEHMGFKFIRNWENSGPGRIVARQFVMIKE